MQACENQIKAPLDRVEQLIAQTLTSSKLEQHVCALCQNLVNAGGKRVRPVIVLACGMALPQYQKERDYERLCAIAAAIELLHTATLIHDDVIDKAPLRRGQPTINETDGNHAAVLAGDYLFTRCFFLVNQVKTYKVMDCLSNTLASLVSGELHQLQHAGDLNISLDDYLNTIYCKTGALFELAAAALALELPEADHSVEDLKSFGRNLGIAFQIIDDVLDFSSDTEVMGKSQGEDLKDGRVTLPILLTLQSLDHKGKDDFIAAVQADDFTQVRAYIEQCHALDAAKAKAEQAAAAAELNLNCLPESPYKEILLTMPHKILDRVK